MRRGEVWWADLPRPSGFRPVILLSRDEAYEVRDLIIVSPLTTRVRGIPTEVPLGLEDGLPRVCVANMDVIETASKKRLGDRITILSVEKLGAIEAALHFALGLEQ